MTSDYILNVSEADFEFEVLAYSQNVPVVVDFWATWCKPCKLLEPLLQKIALESGGSFRLARVDVDENPNLAMRYGIRTLPTLKAFSGAEMVGELVGMQPELRLREFIAHINPPSPLNLAVERADALLFAYEWHKAEQLYRVVLEQNPDQTSSLLGLAKALLAQGQPSEALEILQDFPESRQFSNAELLLPICMDMMDLTFNRLPEVDERDAAFKNAIRLASRGNIPAALDGLMDILRQSKRYRDGKAHQAILGLLDLLSEDDPDTHQYRSELASLLF